MRKSLYTALFISLIICIVLVIGYKRTESDTTDKEEDISQNEITELEGIDNQISESNDAYDSDVNAAIDYRQQCGITDADVNRIKDQQQGYYCFDLLDSDEKQLYAEILLIINKHAEGIMVSTSDTDQLEYVFKCVFYDHPEIFWISGYECVRHVANGEIKYLTFGGKYIYTINQCKEFEDKIASYVSLCLGGINESASEYDKVKYVYEYVIEHTDYDVAANNNQNILSVFIDGKSVCQGYSKAAQYILQKLGIQCTLVVGTSVKGEGHAWNLVRIDNAYYYFDATWGDSYFDGNEMLQAIEVNYDFLNITTEELNRTHVINNVAIMPRCVATEANYYVMEKLFFDRYDESQLRKAFDSAYEDKAKTVTIKCADKAIYETMLNNLILSQDVFKYLHGDTMTYCGDEEDCLIIIWI